MHSGVRFLISWIFVISTQRHVLRERRPSATACPDCWAMETQKVKKCAVRKKKYFVLGWLEQLRQDKNLLHRHDSPMNQPMKEPFNLYTKSLPFASVSTFSSLCFYTAKSLWELDFFPSSGINVWGSMLSMWKSPLLQHTLKDPKVLPSPKYLKKKMLLSNR